MPGIPFEQLFPELLVGCQKQPVLRQDNGGRAPLGAQFQAAFQKHRGKVVFCFRVVGFAEGTQGLHLFAPCQIRHIGHNQSIPFRQQGDSSGQPLGDDGYL